MSDIQLHKFRYDFPYFCNLLIKKFLRCSLTEEAEIWFGVRRTYIEPPVREFNAVTIEVHVSCRFLSAHEVIANRIHRLFLALKLEVDLA